MPRVLRTAGRTQTGIGLPPTADNKVQKQRLERKAKTTKARKVRKMSVSGRLHQSMNYFLQKFATKFIKLHPLQAVLLLRFNGVPANTCLHTRRAGNTSDMRSFCRNSYKTGVQKEALSRCTFWTSRLAAKGGYVVSWQKDAKMSSCFGPMIHDV